MSSKKRAPTGTLGGAPVGTRSSAGTSDPRGQYSIREHTHKAPGADAVAVIRDNLIYRGGRHVAALRDGELHRTFDAGRELWRGALLFHADVLAVALANGAQSIVATDREAGQVYRVTMATFRARSWRYAHPRFGLQWGLDLAHWEKVSQPGDPIQLALFAEVEAAS